MANIMYRTLKTSEKFLQALKTIPNFRRTFLSESYACQDRWNERLNTSIIKNIQPIDFFLKMDHKFSTESAISAVDVDIFVNSLVNEGHIDEVENMLYKLRMARDTAFTLDSTHHAVIRYCLKHGYDENLIFMLNDRLNFGLFCDYHSYNLSMDYFLKKKDYVSAAKIASILMLQEMCENSISNSLALFSCHKYLEDPSQWVVEDPAEVRRREEPEEEVKVKVQYIKNPYFDDHFDLWNPKHIVGKTLFYIGQTLDNSLGRSCKLRGLLLWEKYDKVTALIVDWKKNVLTNVVYKEVVDLIKKDQPEIFETNVKDEWKILGEAMIQVEKMNLCDGILHQDMENHINKCIEEKSQEDIANQMEIYKKWEEKRIVVLKKQLEAYDKKARLEEIEKIQKELVEKERLLTFFEKEEEIELEIEQKLAYEKQKYKETYRSKDDNYVSPDNFKPVQQATAKS